MGPCPGFHYDAECLEVIPKPISRAIMNQPTEVAVVVKAS
jgi:hypothetical protein